jgi:ElaB/YqjD/DUF883 family membrane-anchored ribosome-binding protein
MSSVMKDLKEVKEESQERLAGDYEHLKSDFAKLRADVSKLLDHTLRGGRNGAGVVRDHAVAVVSDLKDRGADSIGAIEDKITERPLAAAAIAFGIGFILARILSKR